MQAKTDLTKLVSEDRYPSRVGGQAELLPRRDPVVWGESPEGPLTAEEIEAYRRNGLHLNETFLDPDNLARCQKQLDELREEYRGSSEPGVITEPENDEVRSIFRVHRLGGPVAQLCTHSTLVGIARQILGDEVYIHQSRINYKPGFRGKEFYWHSDFETWHVEDGLPGMRTLSMSISLTENGPHNGPLLLIPGSQNLYVSCAGETPEAHHEASLKRQEYGVPDDRSLAQMVESQGIVAATGPAGGVTIFDCNTMHGSNGNITPWPRSNVFVVFNSLNNRPVDPFSGLEPRPGFLAEREDFTPLG